MRHFSVRRNRIDVQQAHLETGSSSSRLVEELGLFDQQPRLLVVGLIVLFLLAGVVRLYKIEAPGLLIDREYTSAILARDFYFEHTDSVEQWQKEIAHIIRQNQPILEPPVTEFLMSLIYRAVGREQLSFARLLTSSFWLVGGIFLYKTAKAVASTDAAILAAAYYLFVPMSVLLSRSLQPDSLMMMMFLISLFSILRYYENLSTLRLVTAATISGLTLLYRPLVFFAISGAFVALAIHQKSARKRIVDRQFLMFIGLSLFPAVLYYGYGIFVAGFLHWKLEASFRPELLLHREFWKGWLELGVSAAGFPLLIGALLGVPMLGKRIARAMVVGLGIGYIVFGLVFTMHIHTHGYYHAQLIPIVAFSLGPIVTLVTKHFRQLSNEWYWWLPVIGAVLLVMLFSVREVRGGLAPYRNFESQEIAQEIGEIVDHSSQTVYLAPYYGLPLQYYGELSGSYWPRRITYWLYRRPDERERTIEERLNAVGFSPEYFVITDFEEFNRHHTDLKEFLANRCSLVAASEKYLIYGDCAK